MTAKFTPKPSTIINEAHQLIAETHGLQLQNLFSNSLRDQLNEEAKVKIEHFLHQQNRKEQRFISFYFVLWREVSRLLIKARIGNLDAEDCKKIEQLIKKLTESK